MEYEVIGSSPDKVDCVQVRKEKDYLPEMKKELYRYLKMLENRFPFIHMSENNCYFSIMWNQHDFGRYGEVVFRFIESDETWKIFSFVESNLPETWEDNKVFSLEDVNG